MVTFMRGAFWFLGLMALSVCVLSGARAQDAATQALPETMSLTQSIEAALAADLSLKSSQEGIQAADAAKKSQRAQFFPVLGSSYEYTHYDDAQRTNTVVTYAQNQVALAATLTQPVFTGFALENQYALAGLGLDIARIQEQLVRQEISLKVKRAYFSLLKAQKLLEVARETVTQIEAQRSVAENYYEVGMTPLNDLLQAQVELANAHQARVAARNSLEIARSTFNTVLRRSLDEPVNLQDILDESPFMYDLAFCQETAEKNRPELRIADLNVAVSEREVDLAKGGYYPSVNFRGTYYQAGNDWDVSGGPGISDPEGWSLAAVASWNIWEWGKTRHKVAEKGKKVFQARYNREATLDRIRLEVKESYLRTQEAEENIRTVKTAIEQARENFRINQERYKEQVATNTDVLIAQTLLTRTMNNYYNALYDFQLSKAALFRAMGWDKSE